MELNMDKTQRFTTTDTRKVINSWFLEHHLDNSERLRQSKTWQIIKKYMIIMGHYKAKSRGKPNPNIKQAQKGVRMTSTDSIGYEDTTYEVCND